MRQLEKHIDGLVKKSRSTFSISQEKYDQAVASSSTRFPKTLKYKKLVPEMCCTVQLVLSENFQTNGSSSYIKH